MRTRLVSGLALILVVAVIAGGLVLRSLTGRASTTAASAASAIVPAQPAADVTANPWDPATAGDPCRLLTAARVSAAIGHPVRPGVTITSWPPLCKFAVDTPDHTVVYLSDNALASGRIDFDALRSTTTGAVPETGLGDDAYWDPAKATLHVMSGNRHIAVIVVGSGPLAQSLAGATAVIRAVLAPR